LSKDQIYFLRKGDIDFTKPYTELDLTVDADFKKSDDMCQMYNNEETMLAAVMLLEIALGEPIESFREPSDLTEDGKVHINTNYFTACRLLKSKEDEFFADFRNAVQACLDSNFGTESNNLENDDFRNEIYKQVIVPLEEELSHGFKMELKDIGMTEQIKEPVFVDLPTASSTSLLSQKFRNEQRQIQPIDTTKHGIRVATQRRVVQFRSVSFQ
jgi:hypothetical protein